MQPCEHTCEMKTTTSTTIWQQFLVMELHISLSISPPVSHLSSYRPMSFLSFSESCSIYIAEIAVSLLPSSQHFQSPTLRSNPNKHSTDQRSWQGYVAQFQLSNLVYFTLHCAISAVREMLQIEPSGWVQSQPHFPLHLVPLPAHLHVETFPNHTFFSSSFLPNTFFCQLFYSLFRSMVVLQRENKPFDGLWKQPGGQG